jgi:hypothetical protein
MRGDDVPHGVEDGGGGVVGDGGQGVVDVLDGGGDAEEGVDLVAGVGGGEGAEAGEEGVEGGLGGGGGGFEVGVVSGVVE